MSITSRRRRPVGIILGSPASPTTAASPVPDLLIRIKRATDGSAALTCTRADGSTTWQRQSGALGLVFPTHDLTHYAVETALGYRLGFFGLVADGWAIPDFAAPWPRGPIPAEAREVELVVSLFEMEDRQRERWSAAAFHEAGERYVASRVGKAPVRVPSLDEDDLARVRALRAEVFARWAAVAPGDALELPFERAATQTR